MRLALAQINTTVGDLDGNRARILGAISEAKAAGCDLVLLPELAVTGYPPEDLLLGRASSAPRSESLREIATQTSGIVALVGFPHLQADLHNACAVCADGEVKAIYRKRFLPNYGVFDEDRYFAPARDLLLLQVGETLIGPTICEDLWQPGPPATDLALAGAQLIANISASPFHLCRDREREEMFATRARDNSCFIAFCNSVGAQDELDLRRALAGARRGGQRPRARARLRGGAARRRPRAGRGGRPAAPRPAPARARARAADAARRDARRARRPARADPTGIEAVVAPALGELEQMRLALELGLRDYVRQERLRRRGDRGLRRDRLGAHGRARGRGVGAGARPLRLDAVAVLVGGDSRATRACSRRAWASTSASCRSTTSWPRPRARSRRAFAGRERDIAEENLQARVRGLLLMALSNKFGWLVVATGNKSELSVGYATLYGDMAGGFALLKDVFKTDVFRLARHLNERAGRELIPQSTIERAPSAELRADQRDEDSLPPYSELDRVLEAYVEEDRSREELSADGFDPEVVERAVELIDRAEYKRRQAPPGVRLTPKAFGRDRRTPITNRWRG